MNEILEMANQYLMPNYGELKLEMVVGEGAYVITRDADGERQKCLDLLGGLAVTSLGHCHPEVVEAKCKQERKLEHISNLYASAPMAHLAKKLSELSGLEGARVFFCNSGTEANEAALKLVRLWAHEEFGPDKKRVLSLIDSFHGRTYGSASMTGQPKMQDKFGPIVPGIEFIKLNDVEGLRLAVNDKVCAVFFETLQAEGGVNLMAPEFYAEIMRLATEYDFLTVCDEVQTGLGRTGKIFSFEHYEDRKPDVITLAKALGGGLPMGAMVAREGVAEYLLTGSHAATFGGNPVVSAGALKVIEVIERDCLVEKVRRLGDIFQTSLSVMADVAPGCRSKVAEVRGRGFIIGVELKAPVANRVVEMMRGRGVIVGTAGPKVVRFLPPFIVTEQELAYALEQFKQALGEL